MAKLWQFSQGHPKPAFSEKVQKREQWKFLKNAQKVALLWKAQKLSGGNGIILQLVCAKSEILAQKAAQRVPELPSYGNFHMVTKNPHFLKTLKGGIKGNFSKIAQKVALVWMALEPFGPNGIILQLVCT